MSTIFATLWMKTCLHIYSEQYWSYICGNSKIYKLMSHIPSPTVNVNTQDFHKTLRKRVNAYFKSKNIDKHGNAAMKYKTVAMLAIYFVPYFFVLSGIISNWWLLVPFAIMGFGMAGIGLSVMHDANHGAYSRNRPFNDWVSRIVNLVGGYDTNWRIQHNVLHHTYTNIDGMDEDIDPGGVLRFSPHQPVKSFHRFQHYYAWFLYGLMTIIWATTKDYKQLYRYEKMDLFKTQNTTFRKEFVRLTIYRVFYYFYVIGIPLLFGVSPWIVLVGFLLMHFIAGFMLGIIFQPAHVMETSEFPEPSTKDDIVRDSWAEHQLRTTTNFAPDSKFFSWYVGGLNFQIEHHLFPNICHIHYKKISSIVKETAQEYNLPYNVQPTFMKALVAHGKMLKKLGQA